MVAPVLKSFQAQVSLVTFHTEMKHLQILQNRAHSV